MTTQTFADALAVATTAAGGHHTSNHEPSFWLHSRLTDLQTRWRSGQFDGCPHPLTVARTGVAVAALWCPERLVCGNCADGLTAAGEENRRCDRCGTVDVETVGSIGILVGSVFVIFGLCGTCRDKESGGAR